MSEKPSEQETINWIKEERVVELTAEQNAI
jgi:hypothetical protein